MSDIFFVFFAFLISLLVSSLIHRPILHFAKKNNIYDNPEARKLQREPVPVMGGFVVFFGTMVGFLFLWSRFNCIALIPIQIAMLMMLIIGAWDDIKKLSPTIRFIFEILIVLALAIGNDYPINDFHGLWGIHEISPWIAWPLTVISCVGIINAINMIDGIDGLSSGICIMAFGFYALEFYYAGDFVHMAMALSLIGGLIPFLITNVFGKQSKMYIGDAGTMMLGIALCDMVMSLLTKGSDASLQAPHDNFSLVAFVLAVLAIPVFDTLRVMFGRISRNESPFHPDKTHLHHAFIDYGFHHLETSLMEILLNIMVIGLWWLFYKSRLSQEWQLFGVIASSILVCFGLYWMLGRRKRIAIKREERYGISAEEYEQMTPEERKKLKKKALQ